MPPLALMSLIAARAVEFHIAPLGNRADIAPTTATLISFANAAWEIANATTPAMIVFAFLFMLQNPVRDVM